MLDDDGVGSNFQLFDRQPEYPLAISQGGVRELKRRSRGRVVELPTGSRFVFWTPTLHGQESGR